MSSYLCFRIDGTALLSFCRSHPIYEAMHGGVNFDSWADVPDGAIADGKSELRQSIANYKSMIETRELAMKHMTDYEALLEPAGEIQDFKNEISDLERCIVYLDVLEDIAEENSYASERNPNPPKLQWGIF